MNRIKEAIKEANRQESGLSDTGDEFTWLLALRDRKGELPELKDKLQSIFDQEREASREGAAVDGKFVKIPAGAFLMGGYEYDGEQPVRVVYLSDYWISRYAETFEEYDGYCEESGKEKPPDKENWGRGRRPVINVSWNDAKAYIKWLEDGSCLPTEAQWEKASRGCLGRRYPWGNEWDPSKANSRESGLRKTLEVESYAPCMYGLYQMSGNVLEWCEDYWHGRYPKDSLTNPTGPSVGSDRVFRGGSWGNVAWYCRCAFRGRDDPGGRFSSLGLRLSRTK